MSNLIIKDYPSEKYRTFFNQKTGYFARVEYPYHEEPFWALSGPELLDISITNWCDRECNFCYRDSNQSGSFMSLYDYEKVLGEASDLGVLQIALGGGNPNQHPDFCRVLELTRKKYNIVPSYTSNGRGLNESILKTTIENCGAIAISAYPPFMEVEQTIKQLDTEKIKVNIHFLLTSHTIRQAIKWLKNPPEFLMKVNAIIFLNYKPMGKLSVASLLLNNNSDYLKLFELIYKQKNNFKIGFDSCSISGLIKHTNLDNTYLEPCEAGRFSGYVDENLNVLPCSFMKPVKYQNLNHNSLKKIWQEGEQFVSIREKLSTKNCNNCGDYNSCLGGCPIFPQINLCEYKK